MVWASRLPVISWAMYAVLPSRWTFLRAPELGGDTLRPVVLQVTVVALLPTANDSF